MNQVSVSGRSVPVGPGQSPVTGPIDSKDSSVQFVLSGSISVDLD